jgi:hypothetical protein
VDGTAPTSSASSPQYSRAGSLAVSYTAADNSGGSGLAKVDLYAKGPGDVSYAKVATDSTPSGSGSFNYTATNGDGTYSFYTIATDKAGNAEGAPAGADSTTLLQTTAPTSQASSPQYANTTGFTVTYSASAGGSGLAKVDLYAKGPGDAGYTKVATDSTPSGSGSLGYTATKGHGTYSFYTIATDKAGNAESAPASTDTTTLLDTTAPSSQAQSPATSTSLKFTVPYIASDGTGSGLATVDLYAKGPNDSSYDKVATQAAPATSGSFSYTAPEGNGTYSFYTIATDNVGNAEAAPGSADSTTAMTASVDATPPSSSASSPPYTSAAGFTVSYTAADDAGGSGLATVELYAKGPTDSGYSKVATDSAPSGSGSFSYTAQEGDGVYRFYTVATDNAGNVQAVPTSPDSTTLLDTSAPASQASSPLYSASSTLTVSYAAADNQGGSGLARVDLYVLGPADSNYTKVASDSAPSGSGSFTYTAAEGEGAYSFYTIATDSAGNAEPKPDDGDPTTPADSTTRYDITAPASQASSPTYANTPAFAVSYTASDTNSGLANGRPLRKGPDRRLLQQGGYRLLAERVGLVRLTTALKGTAATASTRSRPTTPATSRQRPASLTARPRSIRTPARPTSWTRCTTPTPARRRSRSTGAEPPPTFATERRRAMEARRPPPRPTRCRSRRPAPSRRCS